MFDFRQKRKLRVILESRITWTILLTLVGLLALSTYGRYQIAKEATEKRMEAEQEKASLEKRKTELTEEVKYLSNERGIEAEMRRQFDVAKEGEQIVIIVEDEEETTSSTETATATSDTNEAKPWYSFW